MLEAIQNCSYLNLVFAVAEMELDVIESDL